MMHQIQTLAQKQVQPFFSSFFFQFFFVLIKISTDSTAFPKAELELDVQLLHKFAIDVLKSGWV